MIDHPCFECELPDCDDTNRGCNLKRILAAYQRNGRSSCERTRRRKNIAYNELYGPAHNDREQVRRADKKERATA